MYIVSAVTLSFEIYVCVCVSSSFFVPQFIAAFLGENVGLYVRLRLRPPISLINATQKAVADDACRQYKYECEPITRTLREHYGVGISTL